MTKERCSLEPPADNGILSLCEHSPLRVVYIVQPLGNH